MDAAADARGPPDHTGHQPHNPPDRGSPPGGGWWRDIVESSWKLEHWARETRYTATYTVSLGTDLPLRSHYFLHGKSLPGSNSTFQSFCAPETELSQAFEPREMLRKSQGQQDHVSRAGTGAPGSPDFRDPQPSRMV